jgi:hypothetical protein
MMIKKFACFSTFAVLAGAAPAVAQQVIEAPGVTIIFGAPPAGLAVAQDPLPRCARLTLKWTRR